MNFRLESIPDFIAIFELTAPQIRAFEGCHGVELLQDIHRSNIISTLSLWESEDTLNHYRNSEMFHLTWKQTKSLFSEKAEATSYNIIS